MKFRPLVAKIESGIAVRSLPEEWRRFAWCAAFAVGGRLFHQGRYERLAVVQKVRGEFETDTHEEWRILGFFAMGSIFIFEYVIDEIMVV